MEGIIKAICISEQKGTEKHPVQDIEIIEDRGGAQRVHRCFAIALGVKQEGQTRIIGGLRVDLAVADVKGAIPAQ